MQIKIHIVDQITAIQNNNRMKNEKKIRNKNIRACVSFMEYTCLRICFVINRNTINYFAIKLSRTYTRNI